MSMGFNPLHRFVGLQGQAPESSMRLEQAITLCPVLVVCIEKFCASDCCVAVSEFTLLWI